MGHSWMERGCQAATMLIFAALIALGAPAMARAQGCGVINGLLMEGHGTHAIAKELGVSVNQVEECRRILLNQPTVVGPEGPPPLGAAGPPPMGAAGPPPMGAAGRPPIGAAGPPPLNKVKRLP